MNFAKETLNFIAKANRDQISEHMIGGYVRFSVFHNSIDFSERD